MKFYPVISEILNESRGPMKFLITKVPIALNVTTYITKRNATLKWTSYPKPRWLAVAEKNTLR